MKIPGKFLENLGFAGKLIKIQSFTQKFQKIFLGFLLYIKYRRAPNSSYFLIENRFEALLRKLNNL
jgi:hypothetical protein